MALYGSIAATKQLLKADVGSVFNADQDARLVALQTAVSLLIEHETGRTFGTGATTESVVVTAPGVSPVLVLPKGLRTITTITREGSWTGTAYTGGTSVLGTIYRKTAIARTGEALSLTTIDGSYWVGIYTIVGTWEDTDGDALVPDDITYVANYLMAERFKVEQASPAGFSGPDGAIVPIRNMMKDPIVKSTLDYHRATPLLWAV